MGKTIGYAASDKTAPLAPFTFERRSLRPLDVKIEILFCGVCHSDLHQARNEWQNTRYPVVPGHEIVGRVVQVGQDVKAFKVGDLAGVGCLVDSCRTCPSCKEHLEQYCENGMTFTYNGIDKIDGTITYGGYSGEIVVDEAFVLKIPKQFTEKDLPGVAPLLCAGITTYSPLRHWKVGKDSRVGVVGIGGLGHMAIKLAKAMGAHVVVFTSSESKVQDVKRLGASEVVISKNKKEMSKFAASLDFIINTVSVSHNLDEYLQLLKQGGTMCLVGAPPTPHPSPNVTNLIYKRRSLGGSLIGGLKETQEMLDFCGQHHVLSDIELIPIQRINEAYERMLKGDVKYRFVIDLASLKV
ncbi:NAD(P)-dependent alcohol dehydrogenase [Estrella lausannensis]|uniref:Alcohol dehydrogenase n=1 Tax=Estrella lausannensis TaxID=483423 RepID=A0A0H5DP48_9BACT|nr:NAD(P)-dependent alcohol dehydrogenase [Estrella lausannensis]CRX37683.1 Alcohol dehydrogenase [Estrella lausannensis]